MQTYRVVVKKGYLRFRVSLYVKIWFFWWFLEGWKIRSEYETAMQIKEYVSEFNISDENIISKIKQ